MPLLIFIISGIIGFGTVFIACEIGHRISDAIDESVLTIEQLHWYLFPIEVQRVLPTIIAIVQQPITFECFGSIRCGRESFKNVGN